MSRVGKLPVPIPSGVNVELGKGQIKVKGPKGELTEKLIPEVKVAVTNGEVQVQPANDTQRARAFWGTFRNLIRNMVDGVTKGYTRELEIQGVGFRAAIKGNILTIFLGFSHEVKYAIPKGITIACPKPTELVITGISKQQVGQVAAEIRAMRKPEPYKGKGVRYKGEQIRMKEGKKK